MMHDIQEKILSLAKTNDISNLGYRKIGQIIGIDHPQQIKHHLAQLIKKGYIKPNKTSNFLNTVQTANLAQPTFIMIPVYGSANCGIPTFLAEDRIEGYLKISDSILKKKKVIALKAMGTSLNQANIDGQSIDEGDYVLVDPDNKNPRNGNYVLSIIDGAANIKKFMRINNGQIALLSESTDSYHPMYISSDESYLIGGVVTQVLKRS